MDFSLKKFHFKFYRYILSRPYPFDHWLTLFITYPNLWIYSFIYSLILSLIFTFSGFGFAQFSNNGGVYELYSNFSFGKKQSFDHEEQPSNQKKSISKFSKILEMLSFSLYVGMTIERLGLFKVTLHLFSFKKSWCSCKC